MKENTSTRIDILEYPSCMQGAVYGLIDIFTLANQLATQKKLPHRFQVNTVSLDSIMQNTGVHAPLAQQAVVIIPPSVGGQYYLSPNKKLLNWIVQRHSNGSVICSVCAAVFIVASTHILAGRSATTHWQLHKAFRSKFPDIEVSTNKILVNHGDVITAGGLMAWVDLGLELVAQYTSSSLMRELGKFMVLDTGERQQQFYTSFIPEINHGDASVLKAQHHIAAKLATTLTVAEVANVCFLGERTFLRKFQKATGLKPIEYIQRARVQKGCDLLESTTLGIDSVAAQCGYDDVGAFRKVFTRIMGIGPRDFRKKFQ